MGKFYERLSELFEDMKDRELSLTRKEFAVRCGIKETQMHNYLNGINNPPIEALLTIAKNCGTNASLLIGESNVKYSPNLEIESLCKNLNRQQVEAVK